MMALLWYDIEMDIVEDAVDIVLVSRLFFNFQGTSQKKWQYRRATCKSLQLWSP